MAVSFIRVDDRMIHGQTCTRSAGKQLRRESTRNYIS